MTHEEAQIKVESYGKHIGKEVTHKETGSIDRIIDVKIIPTYMKNDSMYDLPNKNNDEYKSALANTDCSIIFIVDFNSYRIAIKEEEIENSYHIKLE